MQPDPHLDSGLAESVRAAFLVLENVRIEATSTAQSDSLAALERELLLAHAGRAPADIEGLQPARRLYHAAGVDPTRTRPSSEALLRRVLKGRGMPTVNNAVDAGNELSLRVLLPIGLYDLDLVEGTIELRLGRPGECYPGIRKEEVHLEGRLGLFDDAGPFGSPTSDSPRTCVRDTTSRLLLAIFAPAELSTARMEDALALGGRLFCHWCSGQVASTRLVP